MRVNRDFVYGAVADERRKMARLVDDLDDAQLAMPNGGDIRIPLDLPFQPPPQLSALAMDFLTGPWPFGFVPLGRLHGIRLRATDIAGTWGKGAEISGPVAALMMAVCGRTALLHHLDGPGLPRLRPAHGLT